MDIQAALARVVDQLDLSTEEMKIVMGQIMRGQATEAQIGAFLMGLRMKSETIDEIVGAVQVMRELAIPVQIHCPNPVDICGTGGDGSNLFNVSTASAFVIAAAGGHVAKHGNRAVSSKSGSSDLLDMLGIKLDLTPEKIGRCIEEIGVGFMFAPSHHSAMKYTVGPRKQLGMRTLFNILGPMTNPAGVRHQLIGVFSEKLCRPMAEVLKRLGSEHVLVVHSADGLDEISLAARTHVAELRDGEIREYDILPEELGIQSQSLVGLSVDGAAQSLALVQAALGSDPETMAKKARDMVILNAGAAIYAADLAVSLQEGIDRASAAISSGRALAKLQETAEFTRSLD